MLTTVVKEKLSCNKRRWHTEACFEGGEKGERMPEIRRQRERDKVLAVREAVRKQRRGREE